MSLCVWFPGEDPVDFFPTHKCHFGETSDRQRKWSMCRHFFALNTILTRSEKKVLLIDWLLSSREGGRERSVKRSLKKIRDFYLLQSIFV